MTDLTIRSSEDGAASPKHAEIAEQLKTRILYRHNRYGNEHEIKRFEITHFADSYLTFVVIETGMVGDEGTMAALLCRDYRLLMIGKVGGLTLLNAKNKRKNKGWFHAVHALTR